MPAEKRHQAIPNLQVVPHVYPSCVAPAPHLNTTSISEPALLPGRRLHMVLYGDSSASAPYCAVKLPRLVDSSSEVGRTSSRKLETGAGWMGRVWESGKGFAQRTGWSRSCGVRGSALR